MPRLSTYQLMKVLILSLSLLAVTEAQKKTYFKHDLYFFGNSFTSYNTFAARVKYYYMAKKWPNNTRPRIETPRHTPGGANMWTHWYYMMNNPANRAPDFTEDNWGWVIVQDQSAAPSIPHWRGSQAYAAQRLVDYPNAGDVPVIFMATWGYKWGFGAHGMNYTYQQHTEELMQGYLQYVGATSTPEHPTYLAPCGYAWQIIHDDCVAAGKNPKGNKCLWRYLYRDDGYHPKIAGSLLCAVTVAAAMTGTSPYDMWYDPTYPRTTDGKLWHDLIRDAAWRAINHTKETGLVVYPWTEPLRRPKWPQALWRPLPPPTMAPTTGPPSPAPTNAPTATPLPPIDVSLFVLGEKTVINTAFVEYNLERVYEDAFSHVDLKTEFTKRAGTSLARFWDWPFKNRNQTSYDWVLLQEDANKASRKNYKPCECLGDLIAKLGGTNTIFMQPWPRRDGFEGMNFTTQSTNLFMSTLALIEEANNAGFTTYMSPVGLAFEIVVLDCEKGLGCINLWKKNGSPNRNGLYLAAATTVVAMTGIDPEALDYQPAARGAAEGLQEAARRAILYTIDKQLVTYPWDTGEWATTDYSD